MKFEWDVLQYISHDDFGYSSKRLKVVGGWVLKYEEWDLIQKNHTQSMVFIPDAQHLWEIDKE